MSPRALRSLYTGCICQIFSWSTELWYRPTKLHPSVADIVRLEYQALRKICDSSHGSSATKLGHIANVEPLEVKLQDICISWAARAVRTGNQHIRAALRKAQFPPLGSIIHFPIPDPILSAFHSSSTLLSSIADLVLISWRDSTTSRPSGHKYLGDQSTVADAERAGIALALSAHRDNPMVLILSDSQAAISSAINISVNSHPARSAIETAIMESLAEREENHYDTNIAWVRSHIGIPGNEVADKKAAFSSTLVPTELKGDTASWNRHALSAYTWLRTDRGPQKQWLHHIGKADSAACTCGYHTQDGTHLTFNCPDFQPQRTALGSIKDWEDLDRPIWIEEEDGERWDAVEEFFGFIYRRLACR
ncbi:hypothetical protein EV426DRAFT_706328 [Tirmania nivea]|nr:hypothetical protein EV426DRAFT_706328 [Tirmania nivea]